MTKNILVISAEFTGHGHKSITESLCEKFKDHSDVKIYIIDGFSLGGKLLKSIGKSYGPITRNVKELWRLIWNLSSIKPSLVNRLIESEIKYNFIQVLEKIKPDLILSVHPNFNGSIINILEEYKIKIPVITLIADLVSIYPLWADKRADYIISPTQEAKDKCVEFGVSEEKVQVLGFPVRSRFYEHTASSKESNYYDIDKPLKCLIMSGGEGVGNMRRIAENLLDNFNCTVKVIAGRNKKLRKKLEKSLTAKYGHAVQIYGFMENIQDLMLDSDIAFTRGSPNVMMEAIACNVPLVITDALPGQEAGNPKFAEKYNIGVVCKDIKNIQNTISNLLANNAQKLNQIKKSQKRYSDPYVPNNIVNFILNIDCLNSEVAIPGISLGFIKIR
ncbi:MGDG synthase family glycosyltransferase [Clostridium kluyveri]|uniref:MGDG synthase family glycosyltransferase n=1 Tax=Clostridium kluyveri TaxID=1534 RepID=UPI002247D999|nr:glycosyltransferase [Clostridium kluyveri]UZQ50814.1 glycosyltransferase [Clostridium kluyveri]